LKYVLTTLILWAIAIVTTVLVVKDAHAVTVLLPVFAVCLIGAVVTVKRAARV